MNQSAEPTKARRTHETPHGETAYSPDSLLRALSTNPFDIEPLRTETTNPNREIVGERSASRRAFVFVLAGVLGFVLAVSAAALRSNTNSAEDPRGHLRAEVVQSREESARLDGEIHDKENEVLSLQREALEASDARASDDVDAAEAGAAVDPVRGPGISVVLGDSQPLPPAPGLAEGRVNRVSDRDIQLVVNALWAGGAEAVSVNGVRVGSTTAIRSAGSAVLVSFEPLSPPYTITAIGNQETLNAAVRSGETHAYLRDLTTRFGISVSIGQEAEITMQGRRGRDLQEARPLGDSSTQTSGNSFDSPGPNSSRTDTSDAQSGSSTQTE